MINEPAESFKNKLVEYFDRLSVLRTQIPQDVRAYLLPCYMTWINFQSDIMIDPIRNFGFEIYRESKEKLDVKCFKIKDDIEKRIFGSSKRSGPFVFRFYLNGKIEKSKIRREHGTRLHLI